MGLAMEIHIDLLLHLLVLFYMGRYSHKLNL